MSDGRIEYARGLRVGTFPEAWGVPHGSQFSEERRAWILSKVRSDQAGDGSTARRGAMHPSSAALVAELNDRRSTYVYLRRRCP